MASPTSAGKGCSPLHAQQKAAISPEERKQAVIAAWRVAAKLALSTSPSTFQPSTSVPLPIISRPSSTTEENKSSVTSLGGRNRPSSTRFRTLAQGLSMMNRLRVTDTALEREQLAFASKYGMSMSAIASEGTEAGSKNPELDEIWRRSKWEYIRTKLVVDPSKDYYYAWTGLVSLAYVYNLFAIIFRCVFLSHTINDNSSISWIVTLMLVVADIVADLIYVADSLLRARTGYFDQGLLVRDVAKIQRAYWRGWKRNADAFSLLPFDYALEIVLMEAFPILRFNRLVRMDRIVGFINATETRISVPTAFRVGCVLFYIIVLIHWNACFYFLASKRIGLGSDTWVYGDRNKQSLPDGVEDTLARRYLYSFYWSTLELTTVGEVPGPVRTSEFIFVVMNVMCGVLIFATIVGNVGTMIATAGATSAVLQASVDSVKQYMSSRGVGQMVVHRVEEWSDYVCANREHTADDQQVLSVLPRKLQAEIAMHVHFETLRKVRIFQDCEAGLLAELVLKLRPQTYSPGDYVCRKGDIGREMYIVKKGRLQVVNEDGTRVFTSLHEGAVFGELSILNIAGSKQGNRRSANIRSLGYTDLFVLKKSDLWEALREYPAAQKVLIQKGREQLRKDNMLEEGAPEMQKTQLEMAVELQAVVNELERRVARLIGEHASAEIKLRSRIDYLEREIRQKRQAGDNEVEVIDSIY